MGCGLQSAGSAVRHNLAPVSGSGARKDEAGAGQHMRPTSPQTPTLFTPYVLALMHRLADALFREPVSPLLNSFCGFDLFCVFLPLHPRVPVEPQGARPAQTDRSFGECPEAGSGGPAFLLCPRRMFKLRGVKISKCISLCVFLSKKRLPLRMAMTPGSSLL